MPVDLATLNTLDRDAFTAVLGAVYEDAPWVAAQAHAQAPFADADALHAAMAGGVAAADDEARLALVRAHPDLAGHAALGPDSTAEQAAAGLGALDAAQRAELLHLNARYRARFGFPFVIAARDHDAATILAAARARVDGEPAGELAIALEQVDRIARLRLEALLAA